MESYRPDAQNRKLDPMLIIIGATLSIALHAAVGTLVWWSAMFEEEEPKEPEMEFEKVELLALGEEKTKEKLPRIPNPEPKQPAKDEVNVAEVEEKKPEKEEKKPEKKEKKPHDKPEPKKPDKDPKVHEKDDEKDKRRNDLLDRVDSLHNPDRPTNQDTPEGSPEGVAGGSLSDAAIDNLLGTFQAKVKRHVSNHWTVPSTIASDAVKKLEGQIVVYVELSSSGHITNYRFVEKSSNEQFNESIERVLKKFTRRWGSRNLPMPEKKEIRQLVLKEGLKLSRWEYTGR